MNFETNDESVSVLKMPASNELLLNELLKVANATLQFEKVFNLSKIWKIF